MRHRDALPRVDGFVWLFLLLLGASQGSGQSVADYAVQVSTVVQSSPPQIALLWPSDIHATNYTVYRKSRDGTSWSQLMTLPETATNFTDTTVTSGVGYEYRVNKGAQGYSGEGYVYSGIELPLVESRGKVILVVDASFTNNLIMELRRLQRDLIGDGWLAVRHDVSPTASVVTVRNQIKTDYNSDPSRVKAVLLLGHVPVPYSGDYNADGHPGHKGAWPCDAYYGDIDGTWTDSTVSDSSASDPRNQNVPGDGKFDPSLLPSPIELEVGRVDMANLSAFPQGEVDLLRRYLQKDHLFRNGYSTAERRALIDDHFGTFSGEAFAVAGYRNFAALFGATGITIGPWMSILPTQSYLWGYACGPGIYTGVGGVVDTAQLVDADPRVVFTLLFGSYFGDWDSPNNVMRASLATPGYTLASAWSGRPHWMVHHMGMGETIGFSARVTQNNTGLYAANLAAHAEFIGLLGDPTLRMHPVAPPSGFTIKVVGGNLFLSWLPSPEQGVGYAVYRASTELGSYSRLNTQLLATTNYTFSGTNGFYYMVRAVKLEVTPSGSYYNVSQGIIQNMVGSFGPPRLAIQPTVSGFTLSWPGTATDYQLQSALGSSQNWYDVTNTVQSDITGWFVRLDGGSPDRLFRLRSLGNSFVSAAVSWNQRTQ